VHLSYVGAVIYVFSFLTFNADSLRRSSHIVTPHYDPMLSKLVSFGPDRVSAINGLSSALDEYVIEGVQHNCKLVQSVLRHPTFVAGDTPTSFLPTHYPDGFSGVELSKQERHEYAAAAAAIVATRQNHFDKPTLRDDDGTAYVRFGGLFGTGCKVEWLDATTAKVTSIDEPDAESETVTLDAPVVLDPTRYLATLSLNGKPRNIQVLQEQSTGELKLQMHGCDEEVLVLTKREHELSVHMHEPIAVDTSNVILSPMPGTLVSFAVSEGDSVEIGQEVCVVEAMKMQNIIRAPRRGEIGKLNVAVGASLVSDQMLVEFASPQD
jgi:propionyl-CoA carboxylase alpha chain